MKLIEKKLSKIQFASIVIGIVMIVISLTFFLFKQGKVQNRNKVVKPESTLTPSASFLPIKSTLPVKLSQNIDNSEIAYNIKTSTNFIKSNKLQNIVDEVVNVSKNNNLPTQPLSVTILDINTRKYGAYQQERLRYPASVVKLFWMVYLYAQIEKGILLEAEFPQYLDSMIKNSDNEAASYIIDKITKTEYTANIKRKEYDNWKNKRLTINKYFQKAGYNNINISQKTFPIPSLKLSQAKGSDLKLRDNPQKPLRNQISTQQTARLLYEIHKNQSVSATSSAKMAKILTIDSQTRDAKKDDKNPNGFNPVRGFLSASLPNDIYFRGKAGWTSNSRNDAAIITTADRKIAYILVVFAEHSAYASDWQIFPQISELVFQRITNKR